MIIKVNVYLFTILETIQIIFWQQLNEVYKHNISLVYYINTWVEYILKKKQQLCWNRYFCAIKCWVILFLIPFVEKDIFVKKNQCTS
jgi:hypothetical protein